MRAFKGAGTIIVSLAILLALIACTGPQSAENNTVTSNVQEEIVGGGVGTLTRNLSPGESGKTAASSVIAESTASVNPSETAESDLNIPIPATAKERFNKICEDYAVTGMSLAVFKGQDIFFEQSYGYADKALQIKANENTKYRIASISKTITGIMAMQLVAEGKLFLETGVSGYLGINLDNPIYPNDKITVKQLLTHTSGIVDSLAYVWATSYVVPLTTLLSSGSIHSGARPGELYCYSNFAAGLVSAVIEQTTGEKFYDYADERLFIPMNIDAGFLRTRIEDTQDIALIYNHNSVAADVKRWGRVESAYENIPIGQMYLIGQSDLIISAADLAKFAIALAGNGSYHGYEILPPKEIAEMNTVQFSDDTVQRGLALSITDHLVSGRTMVGHLGQAYGMVSGMYYDPTDSTGIVFITNGCSVEKNQHGIYTIVDAMVNAAYSEFFNANEKTVRNMAPGTTTSGIAATE